jgi:hypothetical protein
VGAEVEPDAGAEGAEWGELEDTDMGCVDGAGWMGIGDSERAMGWRMEDGGWGDGRRRVGAGGDEGGPVDGEAEAEAEAEDQRGKVSVYQLRMGLVRISRSDRRV